MGPRLRVACAGATVRYDCYDKSFQLEFHDVLERRRTHVFAAVGHRLFRERRVARIAARADALFARLSTKLLAAHPGRLHEDAELVARMSVIDRGALAGPGREIDVEQHR